MSESVTKVGIELLGQLKMSRPGSNESMVGGGAAIAVAGYPG